MTADPGVRGGDAAGMEPTRDLGATLPDLLDVMLDKGVYLDLDLIISVADVPLIGVSLRAAVAGVETMLEHGLMRSWDEQTRQWARRKAGRSVPLADGEAIVLRMAGGHLQAEPYRSWRPGIVYLTSRRLVVWRADPREILWQTPLEDLVAVDLRPEAGVDGPDRLRVRVLVPSGHVWLSAAAPQRLHDALRQTVATREGARDGDR
ncbi:gas vesicle protein [Promicromonospora sp. NPDC019610]|uniref:gas vesicle protein n=1 Tax=Promicromonospora sp. NPDC019610 TaxID=3364405 RepID=UPI0037A93CAD